jgi:hypothetical protein
MLTLCRRMLTYADVCRCSTFCWHDQNKQLTKHTNRNTHTTHTLNTETETETEAEAETETEAEAETETETDRNRERERASERARERERERKRERERERERERQTHEAAAPLFLTPTEQTAYNTNIRHSSTNACGLKLLRHAALSY